jgi:hypothetical protein
MQQPDGTGIDGALAALAKIRLRIEERRTQVWVLEREQDVLRERVRRLNGMPDVPGGYADAT